MRDLSTSEETKLAKWKRLLVPFAVLFVLAGVGVPIALTLSPSAATAEAEAIHGEGLKCFPASIELKGTRDRQTLAIVATDRQGIMRDVTAEAKLESSGKKLVSVSGGRVLSPVADGETTLKISYGGKTINVPVKVSAAAERSDVSFERDVMPVFMRSGCNSGSCHGSARGQDGFHLSLFGYDPKGDHYRLTREMIGRRVDLAEPKKSLLLEKSIGAVTHTGGDLFDTESDYYKVLLEWVEGGAKADSESGAKAMSIEMLPKKVVVREAKESSARQRMIVRAKYSDGSFRDVTSLALFLTNDEATATIDEQGYVTAGNSGGAHVFARFDKFTVGSEIVVLPSGGDYKWNDTPEFNYIDGLVHNKLQKLHILPSDVSDDEMFLRRATLDLIGLPPTVEEYHAFIGSEDPDKRTKLIDGLMARDEFVDLWAMKWGEMLQVKSSTDPRYGRAPKAAWKYYQWLRDQISANKPVNEMVHAMLTAKGSNLDRPATNFYTSASRIPPTAMQRAENAAQVFLGTRIQCAQCHNHPFDRWTMDDYYGFTAFFEGIKNKQGSSLYELFIYNDNSKNNVEHPVDSREVYPKLLGGEEPDVEGKDPRIALADWMTSPDNKAFARNLGNRAWAHFFGRGIVDPVDDSRISNPPSNSELFAALGDKLISYDFDMKKLIRDIVTSRTYQLSSRSNETNSGDIRFFSRSYVRRLQAEVLIDTISAATETETRFGRMPVGFRATELYDGPPRGDYFLETFGAAKRETVCACEVNKEATLAQALHLINGDTVSRKFRESKVINELLDKEKKLGLDEIVETLYVRTVSRKPTEKEMNAIRDLAEDPENPDRTLVEDIWWGLINSTEFAFNH